MKVTLVTHHPDPIRQIWSQARICYSESTFAECWEERYPGPEKALVLIRKVLSSGHWSVTRGVTFTFSVDGVSRACSHQMVRSTIGVSTEQQSQRYLKIDVEGNDWYVLPPSIRGTPQEPMFREQMRAAARTYQALLQAGVAAEDARFVLPNACRTNLVMTFSLEALRNFCGQRLCTRAQWEIRAVAKQMRHEVVARVGPFFGEIVTIKCIPTMTCSEEFGEDCGLLTHNGGRVEWLPARSREKSPSPVPALSTRDPS